MKIVITLSALVVVVILKIYTRRKVMDLDGFQGTVKKQKPMTIIGKF